MAPRYPAVAALLATLTGCYYGSDAVVPPPPWWTGDAALDSASPPLDALPQDDALDAPADGAVDATDATDAADGGDTREVGEAGACGVTINEVMMHGATGDDEFVELFNSCASPLTFGAAWTLATPTNGGFGQTNVVRLEGLTLAGNGYLIFVGNGYAGSPKADGLLSDGTDQLSSSGGAIALFDGAARVDAVGWGMLTRTDFLEGPTTVTPPTSGKSIARVPNGLDTNQNAVDFVTDQTPSPRAANP